MQPFEGIFAEDLERRYRETESNYVRDDLHNIFQMQHVMLAVAHV